MTFVPKDFTVWAEIPVTDLRRSMAFYSEVTKAQLMLDTSGPNPMAVFPVSDPKTGIAGHLYEGTPATDSTGPTVHIAVEGTLEEAVERVWNAGGKVTGEPIKIPAGRFMYCLDPDGNSIGLFEAA